MLRRIFRTDLEVLRQGVLVYGRVDRLELHLFPIDLARRETYVSWDELAGEQVGARDHHGDDPGLSQSEVGLLLRCDPGTMLLRGFGEAVLRRLACLVAPLLYPIRTRLPVG